MIKSAVASLFRTCSPHWAICKSAGVRRCVRRPCSKQMSCWSLRARSPWLMSSLTRQRCTSEALLCSGLLIYSHHTRSIQLKRSARDAHPSRLSPVLAIWRSSFSLRVTAFCRIIDHPLERNLTKLSLCAANEVKLNSAFNRVILFASQLATIGLGDLTA